MKNDKDLKISLKDMIKEIKRQDLLTDFKKAILRDIAIIIDIQENGWLGYKIIGTNGYGFKYFYEKVK